MHDYEPDDWFVREQRRLQAIQPYKFVSKLARRRGALGWKPTPDAAHIGVQEFDAVHSAAEFAWCFGLSLDMLVTMDFNRLGITDPEGVRREVNRLLKGYGGWCAERQFPGAWIYAIEMAPGDGGYHAHIAVFIPGIHEGDKTGELRKEFRAWATHYTDRNFKRHIPRAVLARGGLRIEAHRHWRVVTYLLKGYDPGIVVQSARGTLDNSTVYLGDLIPWLYCNPGPIALKQRIRISHSLGPKRREFGVPTGLHHLLPHRPNWNRFRVDGRYELAPEVVGEPDSFPIPRPFRSRYEDGYRDVRQLYPADFYKFVTRQEPYPLEPEDERDELWHQLKMIPI